MTVEFKLVNGVKMAYVTGATVGLVRFLESEGFVVVLKRRWTL